MGKQTKPARPSNGGNKKNHEISDEITNPFIRGWPAIKDPVTTTDHVVVGCFLAIVHAILVSLVYKYVPEAYMDEIFHIRQTKNYCNGDYRWDPMITTPPALYIIAMPLCGGYERYINSILVVFSYIGFCRLRSRFASHIHGAALASILLPVLLHSSLLFYTDLLSVACVCWGMAMSSPISSVPFFVVSCLTRQTNIVFAGAYALTHLIYRFNPRNPITSLFKEVLRLWPFVALAIGFAGFVFINGGIVLGDPSAHQPKLHFAQILYFALFAAAHMGVHFLTNFDVVKKSVSLTAILLLGIVCACIRYGTFDHPYLLADNRHVTFYIWRRLLSTEARRFALAPIYVLSALFLWRLGRNIAPIVRVSFILATFASLIPAHLIEFRYFIVPYVLLRLTSATSPSRCIALLDVLVNLVVFSAVFYLFLFWPIVWENEPGIVQHFMW